MEHDKLSTIQSTLAKTDPEELTDKEAGHLKMCIQDRIRQLQAEICNVGSKIKFLEGSGPLRDGRVKDEKTTETDEERKWKSLKIQENELKSQVDNLVSNTNLLENAALELASSISKVTDIARIEKICSPTCIPINNVKENVRYCFILGENSEYSNTNLIAGSKRNSTVSVLDNKHDDNSTFEGGNQNAVPPLITPGLHIPNKRARLNFDNEITNSGCQSVVQNAANETVTVTDREKDETENKLSQDELELIFKQSFITTADLLNFRCVSSTWRDAATSILLIGDSCQLNLELKSIPEAGESNKQKIVYCKRHPFKILPLTDLLPIMRSSRKFPITSLNFPHNATLGRTSLPIFRCRPELLQFFTLYGKFIKSVFIERTISEMELVDLLFEYTPNLECLSFQSLECISGVIQRNLSSTSGREICSSLKVISTGTVSTIGVEWKRCSSNLKALLDMASNLQSIKNVSLELTRILVEERKVHLLKELNFPPRYNGYYDDDNENTKRIKMIKDLVIMNPKLSVLNVAFADVTNNSYTTVISALNSLLESSKDTLECFKMTINLYIFPRKIRIPIMKNLKHIKFTESGRFGRLNELEGPFFEFPEATSGHKLFPNLYKVELNSVENFDVNNTLMRFFPYYFGSWKSFRDNCVPNVNLLKVSLFKLPSLSNACSISRLFPNIRSLTLEIDANFQENLQNSLWSLCPLAEYIEIIFRRNAPEYLDAVDGFFTGFPLQLCSKLRKTDSPMNYNNDNKTIQFLRVMPSICDLKYLKFLTVRFLKLTSPFISMVSCLYAFKQMPETKITFTCDSNVGISDRKKMQSCLLNVADFVNVDLGIDTASDDVMLDSGPGEDIHIDSDEDASSPSSNVDDSMDSFSD